jgi:mRNA interferase RelE/StbE
MEVLFTKQFAKEIRKVTDKNLAQKIEEAILSAKNALTYSDISELKKLKGYKNAWRIRIGDYRIGLYISGNVIEFVCFMNRKEIYKYFP